MSKLKIEYVSLDSIKPYAGNAKKHPAEQIEQIKKSITDYGFNDPIAVWHGEVVEGHGRLIAATELGLEKVPIFRLDDMTDTARRAYTLVHNKLTLNSGYDPDMLSLELGELENQVDLTEYGFDADDFEDFGYYGDERERTYDTYNLHDADEQERTNDFWQMPVIKNDNVIPDELIGFNYAKTYKDKNVGIHFYIDDYQFERLWNYPDKYISVLSDYQCILSPDFSLYLDMPMPMKIWNTYRSRFIGAFYQSKGIKVIPTISWAEPETFSFCFAGIPKGAIVSISTVSVKKGEANRIWHDGVDAMLEHIEPSMILTYGGEIEHDYKGVPIRYYMNRVTEEWKKR